MNILHMKYALEVAKLGSLNKAAESLFIAQPNISRSIKELEADLGITIFTRSAKGMVLTPAGEEFINYAKDILKQIDQVETLYKQRSTLKQKLSLSVPRASYICEAFADFSKTLDSNAAEIIYKETNSQITINNILNGECNLGIIRYAEKYDDFFKEMLVEKGLCYEVISEFSHVLLMNGAHTLATSENITLSDLAPYIEIIYADAYIPALPLPKGVKEEIPDNINRRIFVYERASELDLLSENTEAFLWTSPVSDKLLSRYNLVQKSCADNDKNYKDVLIYREGYKLSRLDKQFISSLASSKNKNF